MDFKLAKVMDHYEKSCVYGKIYEDRYKSLQKLKDYLELDDFYDIYVRNIAGTELDDEIYLFSKSLIVKVSFQIKANGVFADYRSYRISEITSLRLIDDITYDRDVVMDLEFRDGNTLSIDNRESGSDMEEELLDRHREINKKILESVYRDLLRTLSEQMG